MKKIWFVIALMITHLSFAAPLDKLTVILDWFPNPDHAPLIVAQQQGFFKEQGLDVELIGPSDPNEPPKLVAARKADVAITYEPDFLEQVDQGLPLIRIGTLIDKPLNAIAALKTSNITNIKDLKGKRIGTTKGGLSSVMLNVVLKKAGLTSKDVEIVSVKYNLTQSLLTHNVDAIIGVMRNFEVPMLEAKHEHLVTFFPEEHGIPNYSELIFVTHKDQLNDNRLPRFLAALKKSVAYLDEHPKETWESFANAYPESNNTVNKEAWFNTLPYFAENPAFFDHKEWQQFANFMLANHMIKSVQPMERYAISLDQKG